MLEIDYNNAAQLSFFFSLGQLILEYRFSAIVAWLDVQHVYFNQIHFGFSEYFILTLF